MALLRSYVAILAGGAEGALVWLTEETQRLETDQRLLPTERTMLVKPIALANIACGRIGAARRALQSQGRPAGSSVLSAVVDLAAGRAEDAVAQLAARQARPSVPRSAAIQHLVLAAASLQAGERAGGLDAAGQLVALMRHHRVREHLAYVPRRDLLAVRDLLAEERPDLGEPFGDLEEVPRIIPSPTFVDPLSARETIVLRELSVAPSTSHIARTLGVSVNTVKSQLRSIYRKLGVRSREDALAVAVREGMLRPAEAR